MSIGILAYGSIRNEPGKEISKATEKVIERDQDGQPVRTPFEVEFARASRKRCGAPTLIPVKIGGDRVAARIIVLKSDITLDEAKNIVWRRETGSKGTYDPRANSGLNKVNVEDWGLLHGVESVLYTKISPNIDPLTPEHLADLAIISARSPAGAEGKDGIHYLIEAKNLGTSTPLMPEYERAILKKLGVGSLQEARGKIIPSDPR